MNTQIKLSRKQRRHQAKEAIAKEKLKNAIGFEITRLLNDTSTGLNSEKSDKSVTVILHNKTEVDHDISLFNHTNWFQKNIFPDGVKVSVGSSSYDELMIHSIQNPFMACGLKLKVDDVDQFDAEINEIKKTFFGSGAKQKIAPNAYCSTFQNVMTWLDIPEVSFIKTIDTSLDFKLLAGKKVKITFFLYSLIDWTKFLKLAGHENYISGLPNINPTINIDRSSGPYINLAAPNRKSIWKSIGNIFQSIIPSKEKKMVVSARFCPRNNFDENPKWTERLDITITAKVDFFARVVVLEKNGYNVPVFEAEMAVRNNSYSWNESTFVDTTDWVNGLYILKVYDGKKLKATLPLLRHFNPPKPAVLEVPAPTAETLFHKSDGTVGDVPSIESEEKTVTVIESIEQFTENTETVESNQIPEPPQEENNINEENPAITETPEPPVVTEIIDPPPPIDESNSPADKGNFN